MTTTIKTRKFNIRDYLLCVLAVLALIMMQYKSNMQIFNACLIFTFFVLTNIAWTSIGYFSFTDFFVFFINGVSVFVTVLFFPGKGVALNFLILLLGLITFNRVPFSKDAIHITRIILIVGVLFFLFTSSYTIRWNWVTFYDRNGYFFNNNTVALIISAMFIYFSTLLLGDENKWRYMLVIVLFALCFYAVKVLKCRTALLFFVFYAVLTILKKPLFKWKKIISKLCTFLLALSFLFPIFYLFLYKAIGNFEIFGKTFFSGREKVWRDAYEQIKMSPLFGTGTKYTMDTGHGLTDSAHNMLLGLWKNLGIVPSLSVICYYMPKKRTTIENNITVSIVAITVIMFFESFLMESQLCMLFLLIFPGFYDLPIINTREFIKGYYGIKKNSLLLVR